MDINLGDVGYISDGQFEALLPARSALMGSGSNVKIPPKFGDEIKEPTKENRQGPGCLRTKDVKQIGRSDEKQNSTPLYVIFTIPSPTIFREVPPRPNHVRETFELLVSRGKRLEDSPKQPPEGEIKEMRKGKLQW